MKIDLGDDAKMKELIGEAILQSLDESKRAAIFKAAIAHILTPEKPTYGHGNAVSPLESAFNDALTWHVRRFAQDMIENDEAIKEQLKSLMAEAAARVFVNRDGLVDKIADAIERGLSNR